MWIIGYGAAGVLTRYNAKMTVSVDDCLVEDLANLSGNWAMMPLVSRSVGEFDLVPLFEVKGEDDVREGILLLVVDVGDEQRCASGTVDGENVGQPAVQVVVISEQSVDLVGQLLQRLRASGLSCSVLG